MKSLYLRMTIIFCSVILISGLAGFFVSNFYYQEKLKSRNDAKLTEMSSELQGFIDEHPELAGEYLSSVAKLGYKFYLTDGIGDEQTIGNSFRVNHLPDETVHKVLAGEVYHGVKRLPGKLFVTGFFENELTNSIGMPLNLNGHRYALFMRPDAEVQFGELRSFIAIFLLFTVLFSFGFVLISVLHVVKPLTRLTGATKMIAKGRYDIRLNTVRRDEIGQLASHFMIMSRELERTNKARQEFVANVSHEIESPLTSIQGFAQAMQNDSLPWEQQKEYLSIIEEESRRLSAVSKQLLTLSTLDYDPGALEIKAFDLKEQIRHVSQIMEWKLREKQLALRLVLPNLTIRGDSNLLIQVWSNLLTNAIKYTPDGGTISITASAEGANCVVRVADSGEGIPAEDLPRIFDRFYKVDKARTRGVNGSGLGLSIVRKIVEAHGGTVEAESVPGKGTTFTVTLPQS
ncbi:sensor histidine kinase [Gorillibacterium massiliense]|uniref:sensor histidine kinase n=1 Tax=Gorillibacterium massiliense TaxID=1280390 RepID=UPI0004B81DB8|nr:HAMP domain-containing sensor histidine kinase [Gorillibacterium massiliense]